MNDLFSYEELRQPPLTELQKTDLVNSIIRNAHMGLKYMYRARETAGLLHISYDEFQTLIAFYKLDAVVIRSTIRIPWWSLCEYLIDSAEDMEKALDEYLKVLPHKRLPERKCQKTA